MDYPADWNKHGACAGPIRNSEMVNDADAAIVFLMPDVKSKGSNDLIKKAKKHGLQLAVIEKGRERPDLGQCIIRIKDVDGF